MDANTNQYRELLATLEARRPRLSRALSKAEDNRRRNLAASLDGARLRGLEGLLVWLDGAATAYELNGDLRRIAFLILRAISDFETATEAALCGYASVPADAMRDVMDIEMLLLDFILDASRIDDWLQGGNADFFRPRKVRLRLAQAGINRFPGPTASGLDYKAHSSALHVNPTPAPIGKGLVSHDSGVHSMLNDMGHWEIFEHALRIILPITGHLVRVGLPAVECDLSAVRDAWARTQQMQTIYTTFLMAPGELRRQLNREPTAAEVLERVAEAASRGPAFGPIQNREDSAPA